MPATCNFPTALVSRDIGAAFVVRDGNGQGLAYIYYEDEPGRRASASTSKIGAKLRELLRKPELLRPLAAMIAVSAIYPSDGVLIGARRSL